MGVPMMTKSSTFVSWSIFLRGTTLLASPFGSIIYPCILNYIFLWDDNTGFTFWQNHPSLYF